MERIIVKALSSMEKCFISDKISDKKEKNSFVMFRNEKLAFQVAYTSSVVQNVLYEVKLGGSLAEYAEVKQVVSVPVSYPARGNEAENGDCIKKEPSYI